MAELDRTLFHIVDTETTGLDPLTDRIVEIAVVTVTRLRPPIGFWASLVNPERDIPPEVSAIHMLTSEDLTDAPRWEQARKDYDEFVDRISDATERGTIVAHNAPFDCAFVDGPEPFDAWLCTKRLARHIWPDAPSFRNQALRYWRKLKVDTFGILPHRALADALVTAALLRDLLTCAEFEQMNIDTLDGLLALAKRPILLKNWPKGKFYGKPISAADTDYIEWCVSSRGMTDMDADFRYTLETELRQRKGVIAL